MQKYHTNRNGFTLVEVIVVAVIVLILAAVAIPLYQGYMKEARQNVTSHLAASLASAIGAGIQTGVLDVAGNGDVTGTYSLNQTAGEGGVLKFASSPGSSDTVTVTIPKNYKATIAGGGVLVEYEPEDEIRACAAYHSIGVDNGGACDGVGPDITYP